tara:strand:+ start:351 stop:1109 length:759 start_codon:yes stop_codon:yes gene_type:complete
MSQYTSTSEMKHEYVSVVDEASKNDSIFQNFKQNKKYTGILEHVSQIQGQLYLNEIVDTTIKDNLHKFKINDKVGNPKTYKYGKFGNMSPTTLRYVKVLQDIKNNTQIEGSRIIEIGCGYGGQYTVMRQLFKPLKYTFVDLPEVLSLIERYLGVLEIKDAYEFVNGKDSEFIYEDFYDLVISNYAISECNKEVQSHYIDNILSKSKHGYITHNQFNGYGLDEFISILKKYGKDVKVKAEVPKTGRKNVILVW